MSFFWRLAAAYSCHYIIEDAYPTTGSDVSVCHAPCWGRRRAIRRRGSLGRSAALDLMDTPPEIPLSVASKPGPVLLIATTALVLLNMYLGFAKGMKVSGNIAAALGAASAQLVFPVVIALLFSIGKRFRNARSRTKVMLWTSVIVLIAAIGNLTLK